MHEKPEVTIRNMDMAQAIESCTNALLYEGTKRNQVDLYTEVIHSMLERVNRSNAQIHTLAILADYCKIIE